jgi:hypothetical protein
MQVRFWLDPEAGEPHIYNHGVTKDEVSQVLMGSGETLQGRKRSRIRLGQTAAGRYLQVVYSPGTNRKGLFVITAYDLKGKALEAFRRRRRRKRQ